MPSWGLTAGLAGVSQGIPQGIQDWQNLNKSYESGLDQAGQQAFGKWLSAMQAGPMQQGMPQQQPPAGGMPPQAPPQQMAGPPPIPQGSPPMAPPPGGTQVGAPTPQPMARGPIGQPGQGQQFQQDFNQPGGMGGPQGGGFDIRQMVMSIAQANPGIRPEVLARAVQQAIGTVMPPQIREQALQQAMQLGLLRVGAQNYHTDVQADTATRGQDVRAQTAATAEAGRDTRAAASEAGKTERAEKAETGKQTRFDEREGRIKAQAAIKNDQQWQQLGLRRQALENQIRQGNARQYIAQWRAILDAQHKRTTEIIQAYAVNNNVPPAQRDQMLRESDEAYQRAITDMSKSDKGPTGGGQQPSP